MNEDTSSGFQWRRSGWVLAAMALTATLVACADESQPAQPSLTIDPADSGIHASGGAGDAAAGSVEPDAGSGGGGGSNPSVDATAESDPDAGATPGTPDALPAVTPRRSGDPTRGLKAPQIAWGPCAERGLDDCGTVNVPLDYLHPDGEQITLRLGRLKAKDPKGRIGSVLMNPGGPGESGLQFLLAFAPDFTQELRTHFDLVAWDPRGVPESTAVDCKATPSMPEIELTYDTTAKTAQKDVVKQVYKTWVSQCRTNSRLLPFVSTDDTVSDLELLRAALGDAKLSYVGFSYGTAIGQHYLLRYPDRVRAMVLDGVDTLFPVEGNVQQVDGFEGALAGFMNWCAGATAKQCPFARDTPNRIEAFDALFEALRTKPVAIGNGKQLTFAAAQFGVLGHLYAQAEWPELAAALEEARLGKGDRLYGAGASFVGPPGPAEDPFLSILCADGGGYTEADVDRWAGSSKGRFSSPYGAMVCVGWPVANLTRDPVVPPMLPPVVLVGTTGDPATPYAWAVSAAKHLPGSVLLTSKSFTHTAYLYGDPCIDKPVDDYLVTGTLPPAGIACTPPEANALPAGTVALERRAPRLRPRPRPFPRR
jgi:pimeloyl-ACP methyl ester carboxylesterase